MANNSEMLILLVNYFNDDEVVQFVNNEAGKQSFQNYKIIIVNNGSSSPETLRQLEKNSDKVTVLDMEKNLGYFGGMNAGLQHYLQKNSLPETIIVSNTDLVFPDMNLFEKIKNISPTNADVVAPDIRLINGNYPQNPMHEHRITSAHLRRLNFLFRFYFLYFLYQTASWIKRKMKKSSVGNLRQIYAPHGSFIIFRKSYFQNGGSLNYGSFFYGEEIFLAETARNNNLKILFNPSLLILHKGNSTTGLFKKPVHMNYFRQSYSYLLKTFFND